MKALLLWTILVSWDAPDLHGETTVCVAAKTEGEAQRHGRTAVRAAMNSAVRLGHSWANQDDCTWMPSDD
jgi:hypothetical protein